MCHLNVKIIANVSNESQVCYCIAMGSNYMKDKIQVFHLFISFDMKCEKNCSLSVKYSQILWFLFREIISKQTNSY